MDNKQMATILIVVAMICTVAVVISYQREEKEPEKAEMVVPRDLPYKQLIQQIVPPTLQEQQTAHASANQTLLIPRQTNISDDWTSTSIFASGKVGEEIEGTIVYVDNANMTVYFYETTTGDIYYTRMTDYTLTYLDGNFATLYDFKVGMPIAVRWEALPEEPME